MHPARRGGSEADRQDGLAWLDARMDGSGHVAGRRFTMADITLFAFLDFGSGVGQKLSPEMRNLAACFGRMKSQPSAAA
jgi:glutathione S-transferase